MRHLTPKAALRGVAKRYVAWDIETRGFRHDGLLCVCAVAEGEDESSDIEIVSTSFPDYIRECRKADLLRFDVAHFAHAGGSFDNIFMLAELLPEWELYSGIASGGFGAWSCDLRSPAGEWLRLRDSYRLMPSPLAAIGKAFGAPKQDTITVNGETIPLDRGKLGDYWDAGASAEVIEYCQQDCRTLMTALRHFRHVWTGMGVAPRGTVASTATAFVRTRVPANAWGWKQSVDERVASAYHGGRTERFAPSIGPSRYYDIVSSYPAAMMLPLPTRLIRCANGRIEPKRGECAIYEARVTVRDDTHIPCLPYVPRKGALKDRLTFPTGTFTGSFVGEELECAEEYGTIETCDVSRTWLYSAEPFMREFIEHWYKLRSETEDEALRYIAKIALNSTSGKLIERSEREEVTSDLKRALRESERGLAYELKTGIAYRGVRDFPGLITKHGTVSLAFIKRERTGAFRHAAAAAFVTARGRIALYRGLRAASNAGAVAYCDTDSVVTTGTLEASGKLGQFKLEHTLASAEFLRPKLYALRCTDGCAKAHKDELKNVNLLIRAKGLAIPRHTQRNLEKLAEVWQRLSDGGEIEFDVTRKLKTAAHKGDLRFMQDKVVRRLRANHDKRRFYNKGSLPWSVDQLENLKPLR